MVAVVVAVPGELARGNVGFPSSTDQVVHMYGSSAISEMGITNSHRRTAYYKHKFINTFAKEGLKVD